MKPDETAGTSSPLSLFPDAAPPGNNGSGNGQAGKAGSKVQNVASVLVQQMQSLANQLATLTESVSLLQAKMGELMTDRRVLTEMHDRLRELSERAFENEVLAPLFLGLIGIVERNREETALLRQSLARYGEHLDIDVVLAFKRLIQARKSDRVEIEGFLAMHGVESYRHLSERFDPALQRRMGQVVCQDAQLKGRVAQTQQPGYRRQGRVLRPEYVSVYVCENESRKESE